MRLTTGAEAARTQTMEMYGVRGAVSAPSTARCQDAHPRQMDRGRGTAPQSTATTTAMMLLKTQAQSLRVSIWAASESLGPPVLRLSSPAFLLLGAHHCYPLGDHVQRS